jgi:hypothetical protein
MRFFMLMLLGMFVIAASPSTKVDVKLTKEQEEEIIQMLDMFENMELVESLQFYEYLSSTKGLSEEGKDSMAANSDGMKKYLTSH